uniref:Uncharacterized protein n=1 Tax=Gasterosteus aculeatus TaxID=69293 RepID=G3Q6I3_GASAC
GRGNGRRRRRRQTLQPSPRAPRCPAVWEKCAGGSLAAPSEPSREEGPPPTAAAEERTNGMKPWGTWGQEWTWTQSRWFIIIYFYFRTSGVG